ncbi:MAG: YcxB family protein [Oscillospiraceae bacterium]|nr:YcxB family protein [Oscillospiraceae bacterium]
MVFRYTYTREDYLEATALEKANAHQSAGLFQLVLFLAVGSLAYLNISTLRSSFDRNDSVAYAAAAIVIALLILDYSPRIVPALTLPLRLRFGLLPEDIFGEREFGMEDRYLSFRYRGVETRVGYEGLARVNHNEDTVLFYLNSGAVEAVPMRALGTSLETLAEIARRAQKANARQKTAPLPAWKGEDASRCTVPITEADVLRCSRYDTRVRRACRMRSGITWLWFFLLALCAWGAAVGLTRGPGEGLSFEKWLRIFYILEIPGVLVGALYWYRPAAMVSYGVRQSIRLGRYPTGYLGERRLEWDGRSLAFRYGVFGVSMAWTAFTSVCDDGEYLYFYQGDTLILFLPKNALGDHTDDLLSHVGRVQPVKP